jgi:heavy metal sensor kinase
VSAGHLNVRLRLSLWYSVALALILIGFSFAVYALARRSVFAQAGMTLERDLAAATQILREEPGDPDDLAELASPDYLHVMQGDRTVYRSPGWDTGGLDAAFGGDTGPTPRIHPTAAGGLLLAGSTEMHLEGTLYRVRGATDLRPARDGLRVLAGVLVLGSPCCLAVSILAGLFLARRALRPVEEMASTAERITADSLSERMPVRNPSDEFGRLAIVVNATLARLEDSFGQLRRFTQDAAHELRTPLAIVRSTGETGLARELDADGYRDVISSMLEELDRLNRLVDDLLTLARADSGSMLARRERTDVASLTRDVVEAFRPLAEEKDQTLSVETNGAIHAEADPAILRLAITNLVDNAIRNTPSGGRVTAKAGRTANGDAVVEIADNGPGIAEEHRSRVFERFYRVDSGRTRDAGGTGLGLAIVERAVHAHGGSVETCPPPGGGALFRITLPGLEEGDGR